MGRSACLAQTHARGVRERLNRVRPLATRTLATPTRRLCELQLSSRPAAQLPGHCRTRFAGIWLLFAAWLGVCGDVTGAAPAPAHFPRPDLLSSGGYALLYAGTDTLQPAAAQPTNPRLARPRLAAMDPKVGANIRLGDDPAALPPGQLAQAEPHLARSFTDTNLLLATFQEGRFTDGGAVDCGYALSRDGGQTWERKLIPHLIDAVDGGPFTRASDPVAGVGRDDTLYLNTLAIEPGTRDWHTTIVLSKSIDGGQTFSRPLTVVTSSTDLVMLDKQWMALNTFAGSPTDGRIAVTYTRFDSTSPSIAINPIAVTFSDDGGTNWAAPRTISSPYCQGSQPVFLPDGSLAVLYWNFFGGAGDQIEMVHSPDGGTTFTAARLVTAVTRFNDSVARDGDFLPSATTDRTLGVLYVVFQGWKGGPRIFFTRSRDQGQTWTTPVAVNDTPNNRSVFNAAVAVSPEGQHVSVVFYDKRHDDGSGKWVDLYLAESFDGSNTWQPNLRLSTESSDLTRAPLTSSGRMVGDYQAIVPALNFNAPAFAIWVDTRDATPDPYTVAISRTQGSTYLAWRGLAFSAAEAATPTISSPAADPDADGLPNLLEYTLGSWPNHTDPDPVRILKPVVAGEFTLAFEDSAVATDVEYVWRDSTDLVAWSEAVPTLSSAKPAADPAKTRLEFTFETGSPQRYYSPGARLLTAP